MIVDGFSWFNKSGTDCAASWEAGCELIDFYIVLHYVFVLSDDACVGSRDSESCGIREVT